ncbi:hypothetical protein [bacterium endosymbiont of Bathymodiolus sp. 5 South]|jgi:hypothetical protein|uniref:hypothetical protein n=1 Tax=bacterium endosymbiont of Bathymodiolus sp. 5 South TaxID=1181670 RepID=UPI0010B7E822|nr:hypothetical protein [bacterium endosymbiont of Bathymodiolus sp. 5 South]VVH56993.1 hypothetical protein BSPCLSOX_2421 [uncultured Gammaproteobacteria bacterium]SHN92537.1 hypothetical protein BCLUESOX_2607 [bacterium endosymbiont of Bathymodiolus sp. 5 South]SSC07712.1 hypothetical protein BTURTLESOX_884 [bacterium endosymbiont of Bathymodiolus sp. 5 South]VVH62304.1 hypothetical protein BSPWISOX_2619 [uncultured Gammaproteobacteria bacterium]VVM28301.1 hypothetical protein BSPWISOXPB_108
MLFQQAYDKFENDTFKQALKTLTLDNLPLSVCCRHSGNIDKDSVEITILSSAESEDIIQLKTGVFFREVLAGCVCSDDVSQTINDENGYCELQVKFNKDTNKLEITL